MTQHSRRTVLRLIVAAPVAAGLLSAAATTRTATAQPDDTPLAEQIAEIINRPRFAGAGWGMQFRPVGADPVYTLDPAGQFVAGSAFKVFVAGSAFAALGPDRRFRTTVHGTGAVDHGTLRGDLVLVAGGDLMLGPRPRPDGSLALPVPDHSYGGESEPVPGDVYQQLRQLARQVARRGVRRVEGRVLVDASLFRQGSADLANGGTVMPVSPITINDNIVDVVVTPADRAGAPAGLRVASDIGYLTVVNDTTTTAVPARRLRFTEVSAAPDGRRTVRLTGDVALGGTPVLAPYYLPDPVRFAEIAFARALDEAGVEVAGEPRPPAGPRVPLAEYVSLPLSEQIKGMLKLSSNPHTAHWPYLVGAIAGHDAENPKATGERYQREIFERAGVDPDEGADDKYTSDFFVRFLTHMSRQRYFTRYREALPVMGRDGTIGHVLPDSPAAGRVFAKTGTTMSPTELNKALAGYLMLPGGRLVVFAQFLRMPVSSSTEASELYPEVEVAQGEILNAVYAALTR